MEQTITKLIPEFSKVLLSMLMLGIVTLGLYWFRNNIKNTVDEQNGERDKEYDKKLAEVKKSINIAEENIVEKLTEIIGLKMELITTGQKGNMDLINEKIKSLKQDFKDLKNEIHNKK